MTTTCVSRRYILSALALSTCCRGVFPAIAKTRGVGIVADFQNAGGARVTLEYWDPEHFRLVPAIGGSETLVIGRRIYLMVRASVATAYAERLLWVGDLRAAPQRPTSIQEPLGTTALSREEVESWRLGVPVHDISTGAIERAGAATLSVARLPRLAQAQHTVDRRMRAAMNMSLCGDIVDRLTAAWKPDLTGQGLAVIAESGGFRLAGPMRDLNTARLALPSAVAVEDYRLPTIR